MATPAWTALHVDHIRQIIQNWRLDLTNLNNGDLAHATKAQMCAFLDALHFKPTDALSPVTNNHINNHTNIKIDIKMTDDEDISDFLNRFETSMQLGNIPQDRHVYHLQVSLVPKFASHLSSFDAQTLQSYPDTKRALFQVPSSTFQI